MALIEVVAVPQHVIPPLILTLLFVGDVVLSVINTASFFQDSALPPAIVDAHLSFSIIGCIVLVFFSAGMWLWSSKYTLTHGERLWRLYLGVWAMCLFKDFPLTVVETQAMWRTGWWENRLQSISFIVQMVYFILSAIVTWLSAGWYFAGFLERVVCAQTHSTAQAWKVVELLPETSMPPPLMLREPRGNPPPYPGQFYHSPPAAAAPRGGMNYNRMLLGNFSKRGVADRRSSRDAPPVI